MLSTLRLFLYLICFICITYNILLFGGPTIIKWLVNAQSDGKFLASNISLTPKLDIKIGRLDFTLDTRDGEAPLSGFSRSVDFSWSILNERPFVEAKFGPTFVENLAAVDGFVVKTAPWSELDFKKVSFDVNMENLTINAVGSLEFLQVSGNYLSSTATASDLLLKFPSLGFESFGLLKAQTAEISIPKVKLALPFDAQPLSAEFFANELSTEKGNLYSDEVSGKLTRIRNDIKFELRMKGLRAPSHGAVIEEMITSGSFVGGKSLEKLSLDFKNLDLYDGASKLSSITANISAAKNNLYFANVIGLIERFELKTVETYFGKMPESNFEFDVELDNLNSNFSVNSKINLPDLKSLEMESAYGVAELNGRLGGKASFVDCFYRNCDVAELKFDFKANFDNEWMKVGSVCIDNPCALETMSHTLFTSNTTAFFEKLNSLSILNPLASIYFYGVITAGEKIENGHKVILN